MSYGYAYLLGNVFLLEVFKDFIRREMHKRTLLKRIFTHSISIMLSYLIYVVMHSNQKFYFLVFQYLYSNWVTGELLKNVIVYCLK